MRILEEKTSKLRASLIHWQKWYLEYAALKEEVAGLPSEPPPRKDLARIRRDFDSNILTKKEVDEIFGKYDLKERDQILSVLSRRVDYVEQNMQSLQKLLEVEENKLAAASVVANPDPGTDEATGLPITDIIEQLDEDGNVVDVRLQSGGDVHPKVLEALKNVGIDETSEERREGSPGEPSTSAAEGPKDKQPGAQRKDLLRRGSQEKKFWSPTDRITTSLPARRACPLPRIQNLATTLRIRPRHGQLEN